MINKQLEPKDKASIKIDGLVDLRGDPFIMYDSGDDERILMFSTSSNLKALRYCEK